jgi:hypothetical protein
MPSDFTPEETALFFLYIEFQRIRVPRQARTARQLVESSIFKQADPSLRKAYLKGQIVISESARFTCMREMLRSAPPYFARMEWDIVRGGARITSHERA